MAPKTTPKLIRKRSKIEAKNQEEKISIQDDLGPVLERSWAVWGAILGRLGPHFHAVAAVALVFLKNHFFEDKMVRRRSQDQLGPTKAPKWPNMTPKRHPRWSPKRSKIDVQIDINFDAIRRGVGHGLVLVLWAGTPPQGAPGRHPRSPGEAAQAPRDRPPRHPCARSKHKNHRIIESEL